MSTSSDQPSPHYFEPIPYHAHSHYARHLIAANHDKIKAQLPLPRRRLLDAIHRGHSFKVKIPSAPADEAIIPVGILGAGPGGLYTALMLDYLGIQYQILEASDRTGGRLYTYQFTNLPFDYYDVGAMRFPNIALMKRLFNLFYYPPLNPGKDNLSDHLIPYYFTTKVPPGSPDNGILYFNGARERNVHGVFPNDPFKAAQVIQDVDSNVASQYIKAGAVPIADDVYAPFVKALVADLNDGTNNGWQYMMKYDKYSTRAYMSLTYQPSSTSLGIPMNPLPTDVVNWCETFDKSTGWYDRALTESVLEAIAFGAGSGDPTFFCLSGGSQVLSGSMQDYINGRAPNALQFSQQVVAIAPSIDGTSMSVTAVDPQNPQNSTTYTYANVISTLPLSCLRSMDIYACPLTPMQSNALRELDYGPAIKIGIKFKTEWWTTGIDNTGQPINITGGQSFTDRPIRTIVYPSYGLPDSTDQPTTVLIASYCWTDDAERLGSLIGTGQAQYNQQLLTLVLRDLADVHNVTVDYLSTQIANPDTDVYAWDWNHDPLTQGAYAFFGPGKFEDLYNSLTVPAGNLYFAGEALSARHAWVVGALDSAWQAVNQYLQLNRRDLLDTFYTEFGSNMDWVQPSSSHRPDSGPVHPRDDLLLEHLALHLPERFEL